MLFSWSRNSNLSAYDWNTAQIDITLKLDLYDMVDVQKYNDAAMSGWRNSFEGWLMPWKIKQLKSEIGFFYFDW